MPPCRHEEGAVAGTNHAELGGGGKNRLIRKTENLEEKHVLFTGLNFIKTSVIQQTPAVRQLERRCEVPNFDVKTEIDFEDIKVEPDADSYAPTSTNLSNEVSVIVSDQSSHLPFTNFHKSMLSGPFSTRPKVQNQIFQEAQSLLETSSFEELLNSF